MTTAKDKTKANGTPTDETKAVVVASETGVDAARKAPIQTVSIDVNGLSGADDIPDLDTMPTVPMSLSSEYWTPEAEHEGMRTEKSQRNMFFLGVITTTDVDQDTGEQKTMKAAYFLWKRNGVVLRVRNATARLIGTMQDNNIPVGQGVEVTYLGKEKNKTNSFSSDKWDVKLKAYSLPGTVK